MCQEWQLLPSVTEEGTLKEERMELLSEKDEGSTFTKSPAGL
jgi:hypothetical protein